MQSKSLQDTVCLPAGKACKSMAKMGNVALLMPLNQDLEESHSPEPWRAFAATLTRRASPLGNLHGLPVSLS